VVHRGDIVAVVETEKSTIEVEVFEDGIVAELLEPVGVEVEVGTPLARIEPSSGHAHPGADTVASVQPRVTSPLVRHLAEDHGVDLASIEATGPAGVITRADVERAARRVRASPLARRLATDRGIDLARVRGSGPAGAVVSVDLDESVSPEPTTPPTAAPTPKRASHGAEPRQRTSLRESIAALMARSKREIPHYYVTTTVDMGTATAWLQDLNERRSVGDRILPAALMLKAVVRAAVQVPVMNGHWTDGSFVPHQGVDLGVAISLRAGGLVAPALVDADQLSVDEIMQRLRELVTRAREGVLRASEMVPPSITVTNLGEQGVESVLPVIYPPQVAMVGFGKIVDRPWAVDGMLAVRPLVVVSLAADHRANDGHDGARFLATVDRMLQDPAQL
jgi:pyruvate dehydrogenase E2 component (dihydrolipoamide acetyltransferase)